MTDQEIILSIRKGHNEKPLQVLYKEYPKIRQLILKSGCNEVLAQEIFNDSLLLLIEKLRDPSFELTSKLTTYLYGINRFLVKNALRKQQKLAVELEWTDTLILSEADLGYQSEEEERLKQLETILSKLSEKCRRILELFYFGKQSMEQIAQELNYSSVNSAKTQKYKCIEHAFVLGQNLSLHNQPS